MEAPVRSAAERRADGKAIREKVPREDQAGWKAPKDRRNPIDILIESNEGRMDQLVPIRHGRMLQSPFAFYRGSAALMAADLATTPDSGLGVQACGDAHLMNFGGFATPERNVIFDINDFDETLPGPWEWDLKRLAASVVLAGRHVRLHENESANATFAAVRAYRERMAEYAFMRALEVWYDKIDVEHFIERMPKKLREKVQERIEQRVKEARGRTVAEHDFPKLAEQTGSTPQIKDNPPLLFHPEERKKAWFHDQIRESLALYRESLPEHIRVLFDRFQFCDLAVKVVGVGSVGTMCGVALFMAGDNDPIFLQVKQAKASVLEPYVGRSINPSHGQRVVAGQRLMQASSDIFLGWTVGREHRNFYIRQLRDVKISVIIEAFDAEMLEYYAQVCARTLARAHARSGDAAMISGYMGSSETFDDAICEFAVEYADQTERDYKTFVKAVRNKNLEAIVEG